MFEIDLLSAAVIAVGSYLLGSVNCSVLISRHFYKDDVRDHASGNAGATNMSRTYGIVAGVGTLVGDIAKTAAAALLGMWLGADMGKLIAFVACFVGHCYPVFFGFKGGKGVSVCFAAMFFVDLRLFAVMFVTFFAVVFISRIVSLSSICSVLATIPACFVLKIGISPQAVAAVFACVTVTYMHRSNIKRLIAGQERKFSFKR